MVELHHWVLYESIDNVAVYEDARRCADPSALQVLGLPDTDTPVAISALDGRLLALTIDQVDQLMERLGRARADAVRAAVAALAGGAEVARG